MTKTTRTNKRSQMESRGKRTLTREQEINQGMYKLPGKNRNRASLKQTLKINDERIYE